MEQSYDRPPPRNNIVSRHMVAGNINPKQILQRLVHALISLGGILGERFCDQRVKFMIITRRDGVRIQNGSQRVTCRLTFKGRSSGEHLVEHDSPAPDVGSQVNELSAYLFR